MTLALLCAALLQAGDWPQYRGPNRDDVSLETGLLAQWPPEGPALLWTYAEAGVGYSGPAIAGDRLYTLGGRGDKEVLIALDLKAAGKELWAAPVGPLFQFDTNRWSAGPSATPTVSGGLVYAQGGMGDLVCVDAATGKEVWRKNLPKDLEAQVNPIGGGPRNLGWGFTGSPGVDGDQLVCVPGGPKGTVAALDRKTGRVLWRSAEVQDQAAYTSAMIAEIEGVRQVVVLTNPGLFGVAAKDGRLLWRLKRDGPYGTEVINTPLIKDATVFVTVSAGNGGCELVKVTRDGAAFKAESVYANKNLSNHHGNVIRVGDHVFGHSEGRGWLCLSWLDGKMVWNERSKLSAGSAAFADGRLVFYGENDGTAVLVEANAEGWKEGGRFKIPRASALRKPNGKVWTPPVIAGGRLFLRDQELLFCFNLKAK